MSAGMAGIIAAHDFLPLAMRCSCGNWKWQDHADGKAPTHAGHVAEELAKAGYGNVQETLLAAADEMPIETLLGADKASVWLRQRAHSLDQEGHALVQAIHQQKAADD